MMKYLVFETELGWIGLGVSEHGLCASTLPLSNAREAEEEMRLRGASEPASLKEAGIWRDRLCRYARRGSAVFDGRLDLSRGTPFQQRVWQALLEIPYGETRTYGQVAEQVGMPRAARAVGQAVGRNPLPIIVPCHRVVASDGLGGFGSCLSTKIRLLALEGVRI